MKLRMAGLFASGAALVAVGAVVGFVAVPALASAHVGVATSAVAKKTGAADRTAYCAAFIGSFGSHLGKTQAEIAGAARAAIGDVLKQAVSDGKLTSAQADSINARVAGGNDICAELGKFRGGPKLGAGRAGLPGPGPLADLRDGYITAAAAALGITADALKADYAQGKTLHSLADAKGLTEAQFKAAFDAQAKTLLDAAVASGKLTAAQSQMLLDHLTAAPHVPGWDGMPPRP